MTPTEMRGLWNLLGQTWGAKFFEQYGTEPNDAWSAFLADRPIDAAKYALRGLVMEGSPFPPTLPEFMAWARKWRPPEAQIDFSQYEPKRITRTFSQDEIRDNLDRLRVELGLPPRGGHAR